MPPVRIRHTTIILEVLLFLLGIQLPRTPMLSAAQVPPPEVRRELTYRQPEPFGATAAPEASIMGATVAAWEKLVFESYRDGNWEIYLMDGSVNNLRRLTADPTIDVSPRLDPSTKRVAFASRRTGNYEIFVMNSDGSGLLQLTHSGKDDENPQWSPDGARIAFEANRDSQTEVYVMNADGSNQIRLTNNPAYDGQPTWSPDGARIAFTSQRSGSTRVWVMNANGSSQAPLATPWYASEPSWSPDGRKLACSCDPDYDGWLEACLIDIATGNTSMVHNPAGQTDAWVGSWAPDSAYVAITTISFIQFEGDWYWYEAYLDAVPVAWADSVRQLSTSGMDWKPDWRSTDHEAPVAFVQALPEYTRVPTVTVTWGGMDAGPAGILSYDLQYSSNGGTWVDWPTPLFPGQTSASYTGAGGERVAFRVRARDGASNMGSWSEEDTAATTQFYRRTLSGQILDTRGVAAPTATVTLSPAALNPLQVDAGGDFFAYLATSDATQVQVAAPGGEHYEELQPGGDGDARLTIWLKPQTDLIQNGGFEAHATELPGWQTGGTITPTVTTYTLHSGLRIVDFSAPHVCGVSADGISLESLGSKIYPSSFWADEQDGLHLLFSKGAGISYSHYDASHTWSDPIYIGGSNRLSVAISPDLTVTPQGIVHAIWHTEDGIYYNHTLPDGSWKGKEILTQLNHSSCYYAQIISDSRGTIHGICGNSSYSQHLYYFYKPAQGDWSTIYYLGEGILGGITTDSKDNVFLWSKTQYWQKLVTGEWLPPISVPRFADESIDQIVVDRMGTVHVTNANYFFGIDGSYLYKIPGQDWSPQEVLPNFGDLSSLGVDSRGTLYLLTSDKNPGPHYTTDVYFRSKPRGGIWSEPILLETATGQQRPALQISGQDLPHILYLEWHNLINLYRYIYHAPVCAAPLTQSGTLSQPIAIPANMPNPTLSFFFELHGASAQNPGAFTISVTDALTSTTVFSTTSNGNWRHQWLDLSPWSGQSITLTFATQTLAGDSYVSLALDDITLGAYYPDLWIAAEDLISQPGQPVAFEISYGNHGGLDVPEVIVAMPSSPALIVKSSTPPATYNAQLAQHEWRLGTVAADSGPQTIAITATVAPAVTWFNTYPYSATISAPMTEAYLPNNAALAHLWLARVTYLPTVLKSR